MTIEQKYLKAISTPSDINEHIKVLKEYADLCEHCTEMGVRNCVSTWAFLQSKAKTVIGYDIAKQPQVDECIRICNEQNRKWKFIEADVLKVTIEPTDFLFIDTFHTQLQLEKELALHAGKVKKFLGFHDVVTFWENAESVYHQSSSDNKVNGNRGLRYAIEPFLENNPEWKRAYFANYNNGLLILERKAV